jgi:hypothetical protein
MYATFRLSTVPSDTEGRRKVVEVQLCLEEHLISEEDLPALTPPCATRKDVEEEFERVIAAIRSKKDEAIALLESRGRYPKR